MSPEVEAGGTTENRIKVFRTLLSRRGERALMKSPHR